MKGHFTRKLIEKYWLTAVVLPIVLLVALVIKYGVHVPFWDQWEMVPFFQKQAAGTLGFADFWAQHNEHRVLFPNFILYGLAQITHWDPYYELFVSLVFSFVTLGVTLVLLRRTLKGYRYLLPTFSILAAWLLLSPIQSDNWLWGWQVEWFLSVLGVVIAITAITTPNLTYKYLIVGLIGATLATYSLGNGAAIWVIGLFLLVILRVHWRYCAIWAILGVIEIGLYYLHYINPAYEPSKTLWLEHPVNFARYVVVYLGRPLGFEFHIAHIVGFGLLVLFAASSLYLWLSKRQEFKRQIAWFGLAIYALAGATVTGISRMGFGLEQAFSSRYTTISVLFTLSTIILVGLASKQYFMDHKELRLHKMVLVATAVGLIVPLILISHYRGFRQMQELNHHLIKTRACLISVQSSADPCLSLAYPNTEIVWERLQYLREVRWGGLN